MKTFAFLFQVLIHVLLSLLAFGRCTQEKSSSERIPYEKVCFTQTVDKGGLTENAWESGLWGRDGQTLRKDEQGFTYMYTLKTEISKKYMNFKAKQSLAMKQTLLTSLRGPAFQPQGTFCPQTLVNRFFSSLKAVTQILGWHNEALFLSWHPS